MKDHSILVTGSGGFVARTLLPALASSFPDSQVYASTRTGQFACNIAELKQVQHLVGQIQPDLVINLAAIAHIPTAFANPNLTWQVNLQGTVNLLEVLSQQTKPCCFLQVGSSDCYGDSFKSGQPLDEQAAFAPMNPYAASKAAADIASYSYRNQGKLKVIRARPFNHTGAGQSNDYVVSAFAEQIAQIEAGIKPATMQVGNLQAERSFLHVSDVVNAYIQLLHNAQSIPSGSAFNIAAEKPTSIQYMLDTLLALSDCSIAVEQDPTKLRPSDIATASGDTSALKTATGWQPTYSLNETLGDVLNAWRHHYSKDN